MATTVEPTFECRYQGPHQLPWSLADFHSKSSLPSRIQTRPNNVYIVKRERTVIDDINHRTMAPYHLIHQPVLGSCAGSSETFPPSQQLVRHACISSFIPTHLRCGRTYTEPCLRPLLSNTSYHREPCDMHRSRGRLRSHAAPRRLPLHPSHHEDLNHWLAPAIISKSHTAVVDLSFSTCLIRTIVASYRWRISERLAYSHSLL